MNIEVTGCGKCPLKNMYQNSDGVTCFDCGHPDGMFVRFERFAIPEKCPIKNEPLTIIIKKTTNE